MYVARTPELQASRASAHQSPARSVVAYMEAPTLAGPKRPACGLMKREHNESNVAKLEGCWLRLNGVYEQMPGTAKRYALVIRLALPCLATASEHTNQT